MSRAVRGVRALMSIGQWAAVVVVAVLVTACGGGGGGGSKSGSNPPSSGGGASVCGGAITSVPKLCNLRVRPNPVPAGCPVRISFGISDREGDIDKLCVGVAIGGSDPEISCDFLVPRGQKINETITLDPLDLDLPPWLVTTYTIAFNVGDTQGHISNTVVTTFQTGGGGSCN